MDLTRVTLDANEDDNVSLNWFLDDKYFGERFKFISQPGEK